MMPPSQDHHDIHQRLSSSASATDSLSPSNASRSPTSSSSASSSSPSYVTSSSCHKRWRSPELLHDRTIAFHQPLSPLTPTSPRQPLVSPLKPRRRLFNKRRRRIPMLLIILVCACVFAALSLFCTVLIMSSSSSPARDSGADAWFRPWTSMPRDAAKLGNLKGRKLSAGSPSPRIVYLEHNDDKGSHRHRHRLLEKDPMLSAPPGEEAVVQDRFKPDDDDNPDCVPIADWQTRSYPNCNQFHEMDLPRGIDEFDNGNQKQDNLSYLARGWFRSTWQWGHAGDEPIVLKMLRLEREFYDEYFELHRKDAVAMERLSSSHFVMDIYGFCGQSALNELASFPNGLNSLEKFDRNLRKREGPEVNLLKLHVATSVAVGLAHVHEIDDRPSMVHYDMNPRNIAIVKGGKPKLNDFNIAEFLRYNPQTNQTCGFRSRLHEPWWRAPEEVVVNNTNLLTEKVDVYSLGNLLYHILTTRSPHGKMKRERMEEVRPMVARGDMPVLGEPYRSSVDPAVVALRKAMHMCYESDPLARSSAREVANVLMDTLLTLKDQQEQKQQHHKRQQQQQHGKPRHYDAVAMPHM